MAIVPDLLARRVFMLSFATVLVAGSQSSEKAYTGDEDPEAVPVPFLYQLSARFVLHAHGRSPGTRHLAKWQDRLWLLSLLLLREGRRSVGSYSSWVAFSL